MSFVVSLFKSWRNLQMLFAPRRCFVCRRILRRDEEILCTACLSDIQQTGIFGEPNNVVERLFWGVTPVERAASWLKYTSGSNVGEMIHALKYAGMIRIGHLLGRAMGRAMDHHGFFDGVDLIVPVPLHKRKEDERGYNQSAEIAYGVSEVTGLPVSTTAVIRGVDTPTQTLLSPEARMKNVSGAFVVARPEEIMGKHILFIDDVLTTGATTISCLKAVSDAPWFAGSHTRMSVLTLALAGQHFDGAAGYRPWNPFEPSLKETSVGIFGNCLKKDEERKD